MPELWEKFMMAYVVLHRHSKYGTVVTASPCLRPMTPATLSAGGGKMDGCYWILRLLFWKEKARGTAVTAARFGYACSASIHRHRGQTGLFHDYVLSWVFCASPLGTNGYYFSTNPGRGESVKQIGRDDSAPMFQVFFFFLGNLSIM